MKNGISNGNIYLVHFYQPNDGQSYDFAQELSPMADKLAGIVTVAFIDCQQSPKVCQDEVKNDTPSIVLYAPVPFPVEIQKLKPETGKTPYQNQIKELVNKAIRYVNGQSIVQVHTDDTKLKFL